MQTGGKPKRVKLTVDLTRYDERCKIGELGWTVPDTAYGMWARQYDRFVAVKFDNGAKLDVVTKSLVHLDKEETTSTKAE